MRIIFPEKIIFSPSVNENMFLHARGLWNSPKNYVGENIKTFSYFQLDNSQENYKFKEADDQTSCSTEIKLWLWKVLSWPLWLKNVYNLKREISEEVNNHFQRRKEITLDWRI